ncbi:MAG: hypothetical protein QOG46_1265 [Pseudonocardiales bacterium]|nr:hypothetical protein [Pseudonocardiales bacterium]
MRLSSERREEVLLAQAVDSAVSRLRPGLRPDAGDDELVAIVDQVLADLAESSANGVATAIQGPTGSVISVLSAQRLRGAR